jgi:prepilin-type N-terminal cleavage/methylation domain-containing protein
MIISSVHSRRRAAGFSLIEALIVLTIIGIMASIIISAMSNAAKDSRNIMARQQQVTIQSALNSWVASQSTGTSIGQIRTTYNAATTARAKLDLFQTYLSEDTYNHLLTYTTNNAKLTSDAMTKVDKWIELNDWNTGSYPKVELLPTP